MKILRFRTTTDPSERVGVVATDGVIDLSARDVRTADGTPVDSLPVALTAQGRAALDECVAQPADVAWSDVVHLVPVDAGSKILCAGANYHKRYPLGGEVQAPPQPVYFNKPPGVLAAHGEELVVPAVSPQLDYEVELAVVIGERCRHVDAADALAAVAGYTVLNDGSVRNYQRHSTAAGKNFHHAGSAGPHITSADELPEPHDLSVSCWVNGERRQHASVSEMIFGVGELIAYLSSIMWLLAGDVISTGSPEGTGGSHDPPRWLVAGDEVRCEVSGVGVLENVVVAEAAV